MDMDSALVRRLVWDALYRFLSDPDFFKEEHLPLEAIGLLKEIDRDHFKALLVRSIFEAGYEIDPAMIPTGADNTPIEIMSAVWEAAIKLSNIDSRFMLDLPGEPTKGNKP